MTARRVLHPRPPWEEHLKTYRSRTTTPYRRPTARVPTPRKVATRAHSATLPEALPAPFRRQPQPLPRHRSDSLSAVRFRRGFAALPRHVSRHPIGTHPAPCRPSQNGSRGLPSKGAAAERLGTVPQPCRRDPRKPSGRAPDPRGDWRPDCTSACARAGNDSACIAAGVPRPLPTLGGGGDWPLRQTRYQPRARPSYSRISEHSKQRRLITGAWRYGSTAHSLFQASHTW